MYPLINKFDMILYTTVCTHVQLIICLTEIATLEH